MKKWISAIVVLLLLVLLAAPGGMGMLAQKRINQLVQQLPADSPIGLHIVSYKRGWFSSTMQLDVTLNKIQHTPPIHFLVNETIKHGPVIVDLNNKYMALGQAFATGELIVPDDEQAFFKQYVDQTNLLNSSLLLHLFGGFSLNFNIAELTISDPADKSVKITLEGVSSSIEMNGRMDRLASNFQLQSFSGQSAQSIFALNNLEGDSNLAQTPHKLWLGKVNVQTNDASLNTDSKPVFDVKGIQYSSDSSETKGLLDASNNVSLQSVALYGADYGSGQVGLSVKNINAEPLEALKALTKEISQAQQAQSGLAATLKLQQKALQSRQLIFQILGRGVQFAIEPIAFKTPKGEIQGKFTLNLPNLLTDDKGNPVARPIITIGALVSNANSALSLSIPKVIVQEELQKSILQDMQAVNQTQATPLTPEQLNDAATQRTTEQVQNWVSSGFLIENGNNYEFSASYDKGQLLANGKPVFSPVSQAFSGAAGNPTPAVPAVMPGANATPTEAPAPAASSAPAATATPDASTISAAPTATPVVNPAPTPAASSEAAVPVTIVPPPAPAAPTAQPMPAPGAIPAAPTPATQPMPVPAPVPAPGSMPLPTPQVSDAAQAA